MSTGDRWNYPNGAVARFGSSWRAPSGQQVSEPQLSWAIAPLSVSANGVEVEAAESWQEQGWQADRRAIVLI